MLPRCYPMLPQIIADPRQTAFKHPSVRTPEPKGGPQGPNGGPTGAMWGPTRAPWGPTRAQGGGNFPANMGTNCVGELVRSHFCLDHPRSHSRRKPAAELLVVYHLVRVVRYVGQDSLRNFCSQSHPVRQNKGELWLCAWHAASPAASERLYGCHRLCLQDQQVVDARRCHGVEA